MGEVAESMINGEACHNCGVHLEPEEVVYLVHCEYRSEAKTKMPKDGRGFGTPVYCEDCENV